MNGKFVAGTDFDGNGIQWEIPKMKETWSRKLVRIAIVIGSVAMGVFVGFKAFCFAGLSLPFIAAALIGTAAAIAISIAVYVPFQTYESLLEATRFEYFKLGVEEARKRGV